MTHNTKTTFLTVLLLAINILHVTAMKEYSRGQNNRQYNHQQLGTSISQYVSCYGIVYCDPNGTPDNEQDDWYSSISDRIPAKEFVTILTNCTAMVDHGSINRIKARRTTRIANNTSKLNNLYQQQQSWGSFLKNFFTAMTTAFSSSSVFSAPQPSIVPENTLDYKCYISSTDISNQYNTTAILTSSLPTILQYDPHKDLHTYIMCAIDTCVAFRIPKDEEGDEYNDHYAQVMTILKNFYEHRVQNIQQEAIVSRYTSPPPPSACDEDEDNDSEIE